MKVTQIAFPETVNNSVHAHRVYASRGTNPIVELVRRHLRRQPVAELVTPAGDPSNGFTAAFQVGVAL